MALAKEHKCSFLECSAKTRENVQQCFAELILKVYFQEMSDFYLLFKYGMFQYEFIRHG